MNNFCPVENDTIRHYAEPDYSDDLQSEVDRYVKLYTSDIQGINTLRDEMPEVEDMINKLLVEIITSRRDSLLTERDRKFRMAVFVAASKLAGRKIADDIKQAQEDAAVERYINRQERCEA